MGNMKLEVAFMFSLLFWAGSVVAQPDTFQVKDLLESLIERTNEFYVDSTANQRVNQVLEFHIRENTFGDVESFDSLERRLNRELFRASGDYHLSVSYQPDTVTEDKTTKRPSRFRQRRYFRKRNRRIKKGKYISISQSTYLSEYIAYLKVDAFYPTKQPGIVPKKAMRSVKHSPYLIIDLRGNGGGLVESVEFLSEYLCHEDSLFFYTFMYYQRSFYDSSKAPYSYRTSHIKRKRTSHFFDQTQLYILTNDSTFSSAEVFAQFLKRERSAKIVGEKTQGFSLNGNPMSIEAGRFTFHIPTKRIFGPELQPAWPQKGITPDILCEADEALEKAMETIELEIKEKKDLQNFIEKLVEVKRGG